MAAPSKKLYIGVLVVAVVAAAAVVFALRGKSEPTPAPAGTPAPEIARGKAVDGLHLGKPLERKGRVIGYVVSSVRSGPIRELDLSGKVVREWTARSDSCGIEVLANGNLLLGSGRKGGSTGKVWEIDRDGKTVWEISASVALSHATDVSRLGNGSTLVTDQIGGRVVEFTPEGKEAWSYKCVSPYSAQRLADGNTLIGNGRGASSGCVIEGSPAGEVVWEKKGFKSPIHVRRVANGKTLVADNYQDKVIEVDRNGEVVWEYKCEGPIGAERLPDGKTLVSSYERKEIILVSPDGKEEVLYKGADGRACAIYEGK